MNKFFQFLTFLSFSLVFNLNTKAQNFQGNKEDIDIILNNTDSFSHYYMSGQYKKLAECYSSNGKIFPGGSDIIEGTVNIEKKWIVQDDIKVIRHVISPSEIKIIDDHAYDYGYYEGRTLLADGTTTSWKGKYVIIWRKEGNDWKIYLDIWNRID